MSRHLIAVPMIHDDAVMVVGWDPDRRTYFCEIEYPGGIYTPIHGDLPGEIGSADRLAQVMAWDGIRLPPVLVARLRLEVLAVSTANLPHLDWRGGEPDPVT